MVNIHFDFIRRTETLIILVKHMPIALIEAIFLYRYFLIV